MLHAQVLAFKSSCRHAGAYALLRRADCVLRCVCCRRTLAAVHSGADLSAAIDGVLGYDAGECKGEASWSVQP
jgi:hypothetical protein